METSRHTSNFAEGPTFGVALAAVLIGGFFSGLFESLLFNIAPLVPRAVWTIATSVIAAVGIRIALRMFGYDIALIAAVCASAVGSVVSVVLRNFFLGAGGPALFPLLSASGFAGILLTSWIVQNMAQSHESGFH
jgi:hypothetical protein